MTTFVWILKVGDRYKVQLKHRGRVVSEALPETGPEALQRAFRWGKETRTRVAFIPQELKPPVTEKVAS